MGTDLIYELGKAAVELTAFVLSWSVLWGFFVRLSR